MFEIPLWGALSQEFWIRHNHELSAPTVRILFADDPLDFVASSTGTLDFVTTTVQPKSACVISRAAA